MRFHEFAPAPKPVLKISQQKQALQAQQQKQRPATPWPVNKQSTVAPASVNVTPEQWKDQWVQKYLAARLAQDAQTVQPSEEDIVKAYMRNSDAQRQADQGYAEKYGQPDEEDGWRDDHRWTKRD